MFCSIASYSGTIPSRGMTIPSNVRGLVTKVTNPPFLLDCDRTPIQSSSDHYSYQDRTEIYVAKRSIQSVQASNLSMFETFPT